jgi:hypothetical protein
MLANSLPRNTVTIAIVVFAVGFLLVCTTPALAQIVGAGSMGGAPGGIGSGGSSFGGSGGSFSGGTAGGLGGGFSGSFTGSGTASGTLGFSTSQYAPSQFTSTNVPGGGIQGLGGASGGVSAGVQPSNIFASYYANPLAAGLPNLTRVAFGTPLYKTTTTTSQFTTGAGRGVGAGGYGSSGIGTGGAAPSSGLRRSPSYSVALGFDRATPTPPPQMQANLQGVLASSTSLSQNRAIRIDMVGPTVVLRGMVTNDHDRRLAESLIRLTPGVRDVRNELKTLATLPPAK